MLDGQLPIKLLIAILSLNSQNWSFKQSLMLGIRKDFHPTVLAIKVKNESIGLIG